MVPSAIVALSIVTSPSVLTLITGAAVPSSTELTVSSTPEIVILPLASIAVTVSGTAKVEFWRVASEPSSILITGTAVPPVVLASVVAIVTLSNVSSPPAFVVKADFPSSTLIVTGLSSDDLIVTG